MADRQWQYFLQVGCQYLSDLEDLLHLEDLEGLLDLEDPGDLEDL
jgi:hypothetical protein